MKKGLQLAFLLTLRAVTVAENIFFLIAAIANQDYQDRGPTETLLKGFISGPKHLLDVTSIMDPSVHGYLLANRC